MNAIKKFFIPALALGMFAACSDDNKFDGPENGSNDVDRVQYLNISIVNDGSFGRAYNAGDGTYEDGQGDENAIKNIYFAFYDASGNFVTSVGPKTVAEFTKSDNPEHDITVETVLSAVVPVELEKGSSDPAYVMCYINPVQTAATPGLNDQLGAPTIGDIKNIKRMEVSKPADKDDKSAKNYFGMSNSVYYDKDSHELVNATSIPKNALKLKEEDAKTATPIKIFVERYAAKVTVSYASATNNSVNLEEDKYKLTFNVENWYLNAREKQYYVSKNYTKTVSGDGLGAMGAESVDYNTLNLNLFSGWNAPELHRSFWARSVSYFGESYPDVSDDVVYDVDGNGNFTLDYYSYNKITDGAEKLGLESGKAIYALENTIGLNALKSATNTLAALSSVVLVGRYSLDGYDPNTTFFVRENKVYFETEDAKDGDITIYQGLLGNNQNAILQVEVEGEGGAKGYKYVDGSETSLLNYLEVYHPERKTENAVSVRIKEDLTHTQISAAKLHYLSSGVRKAISTKEDIEAMNTLLLANIGVMDAYKGGMAFYSIPIHHLGWQRNDNANKDAATIDWNKVKEGDFGIVRNHSYNINITEIGGGLATGIFNPNKPIVPEKTKTTWYGNYQLRILAWRIVPTQDVKL
ncbi:MAG: fimbria major subunit [Muribaculum sp.]|nr:fimbria major subunit [Muribaculum sp.]